MFRLLLEKYSETSLKVVIPIKNFIDPDFIEKQFYITQQAPMGRGENVFVEYSICIRLVN